MKAEPVSEKARDHPQKNHWNCQFKKGEGRQRRGKGEKGETEAGRTLATDITASDM